MIIGSRFVPSLLLLAFAVLFSTQTLAQDRAQMVQEIEDLKKQLQAKHPLICCRACDGHRDRVSHNGENRHSNRNAASRVTFDRPVIRLRVFGETAF